MLLWLFKSLAGKKSTNFVALNTLSVVVDHGQHIMLKTSSLFVHSQEDCPHSHCFVRQIAREAHISRSSVHYIIKKDLQIGLNLKF